MYGKCHSGCPLSKSKLLEPKIGANFLELWFYQQAASTMAECHMRCFLEISKQTQTNCTVSSFQILAKGTTVSHDSPRMESCCRFSLNTLLRLTWAQCTDTDNIFVEQFLSQSLSLVCQRTTRGLPQSTRQ